MFKSIKIHVNASKQNTNFTGLLTCFGVLLFPYSDKLLFLVIKKRSMKWVFAFPVPVPSQS